MGHKETSAICCEKLPKIACKSHHVLALDSLLTAHVARRWVTRYPFIAALRLSYGLANMGTKCSKFSRQNLNSCVQPKTDSWLKLSLKLFDDIIVDREDNVCSCCISSWYIAALCITATQVLIEVEIVATTTRAPMAFVRRSHQDDFEWSFWRLRPIGSSVVRSPDVFLPWLPQFCLL